MGFLKAMNIYPEFQHQYKNYIEIGSQYLSNKKICATGLIRNGADHIKDKLQFFNLLRNHCAALDVIIYENDSSDNTAEILNSWSDPRIQFKIISETLNAQHRGHPHKDIERTMAMAHYRNKCQNYIREYINVDYIIVLDLDYIDISFYGILNSFGWISEISSIDMMAGFSYHKSQNNILSNYDSWAYRGNWWNDYQSDPYFGNSFFYSRPFIGSSPFKVNSAFGGSCIYKQSIYLTGKYSGEDCEHVTFHKSIYNNNPNSYNLYVNPSQIMIL